MFGDSGHSIADYQGETSETEALRLAAAGGVFGRSGDAPNGGGVAAAAGGRPPPSARSTVAEAPRLHRDAEAARQFAASAAAGGRGGIGVDLVTVTLDTLTGPTDYVSE